MKLKKFIYILLSLFIIGCKSNDIKKITPNEFEMEYKESKILHTMKSYELLFVKEKYVFLKKQEMSVSKNRWEEEILYTRFDKLKPKTQKEIGFAINKKGE